MEIFPESTCRVCLNEKEILISIFDHVDEFASNISDLLLICGDLQIVEVDNFPKFICEECVQELFIAIKFREKCKVTKNILAQLDSHLKNNSIELVTNEETTNSTNTYSKDEILPDTPEEIIHKEYETGEISIIIDNQNIIINQESGEDEDENEIQENFVDPEESINTAQSFDDNEIEFKYDQNNEETEITENLWLNLLTDSSSSSNINTCNKSRLQPKNTVYDCSQIHYVVNCKCDVCGAGFTHPENLKKHMYSHDTVIDIEAIVECVKCFHPFSKMKHLNEHMIEQHKIENVQNSNNDDNAMDTILNQNEYTELSQIVVLDDNTQEIVAIAQSMELGPNGSSNKTAKRFNCKICDRGFTATAQLQVHMRTHTGERPFKCSKCDKTFAQNGGLKLHERRHENIRPYICSICEKGFHESSNLKVHMRIHTGERPHKCTICDKSYSRVYLLQNHLRLHTGERPHKCEECNKAFIQKSDLVVHRRMHLNKRPYTCSICGHGFVKRCILQYHLASHKNKVNRKIKEEPEYNVILIDPEKKDLDIYETDLIEEDEENDESSNMETIDDETENSQVSYNQEEL